MIPVTPLYNIYVVLNSSVCVTNNPQPQRKTITCRNGLWKTSLALWKKFDCPVEAVGNLWGKVGIKIRIAKKSEMKGVYRKGSRE